MASHSSTLAWKIPWMNEPGRLQSMGLLRVGHGWATSLSLFNSCIGEGNGNPLQCSCLENPGDGRAWWAAVYGVAQSWTRLSDLAAAAPQYFMFILLWSYYSLLRATLCGNSSFFFFFFLINSKYFLSLVFGFCLLSMDLLFKEHQTLY